jgi:hypothetical protein
LVTDVGCGDVDPADNTCHERGGSGKVEQVLGLGDVGDGLHDNAGSDTAGLRLHRVFVDSEAAP